MTVMDESTSKRGEAATIPEKLHVRGLTFKSYKKPSFLSVAIAIVVVITKKRSEIESADIGALKIKKESWEERIAFIPIGL